MSTLLAPWNRLRDGWNHFWFDSRSEADLSRVAAFRLVFGLVMFFCYVARIQDLEFFYAGSGILPDWHRRTITLLEYNFTFIGDWSPGKLHALHGLFLLSLLALALGFFTRFAAILAYVLHVAFVHRNPGVMFGVDMISTFFFLYLCFADANARWSLDAWLGRAASRQSLRGHLAFRLMQIQLCVVYGFSGLEKLKGTRWWDGSALWDVLSMGNLQRFDLSFVAHVPLALASVVYVVLFFEVYFPVLVWLKNFRLPMLAFGLAMHLGIFVFMNLPSFAFMMISLYVLFLTPAEVERSMQVIGRLIGRLSGRPIPSRS